MNGTLLLVEDEALILMDLEFAAEDAGYDYCAVRSVQAALEALETRDIVAAVLVVGLFDRPPILVELLVYIVLGLLWALPFKAVFKGVGKEDPEAGNSSD